MLMRTIKVFGRRARGYEMCVSSACRMALISFEWRPVRIVDVQRTTYVARGFGIVRTIIED